MVMRAGGKQVDYSTSNPPPVQVVRSVMGPSLFDLVIRIEHLGKGLSRKVTTDSAEIEAAVAQIRAGYERWTIRFRNYVESAASEMFLTDYSPERMGGLLNGLMGEGIGLASYFLGALVERENFHANSGLWRPLVDCSKDLLDDLRGILRGLEKVLAERQGKQALKDLGAGDVGQKEIRELAEKAIKSLEKLCDLLYKEGVDAARIQETCSRVDIERVVQAAEDGIRWIEEQGGSAFRHGGVAGGVLAQGEVVPLTRPTAELVSMGGDRINSFRKGFGLLPLHQRDQVIHEVFRHWLVMEAPYIPSPFHEGRYASSANSKSHLEQDLALIAEESEISFRTLKNYIDTGQVIAAWAARTLAQAWKAARRVQTYYRYDILEVKGQAVRGGPRGYKFVASGHAQPVPKGSLTAVQVDALLAQKGRAKSGPAASGIAVPPKAKKPEAGKAKKALLGRSVKLKG